MKQFKFCDASRGFCLVLCLTALMTLPAGGQFPSPIQDQQPQSQMPGSGQNTRRAHNGPPSVEDTNPFSDTLRVRMLNADRQKTIVSDTNKLLKLAAELKAEISSAKQDSLTPEQLHKVAEIEKLARNVKTRMSITMGSGPVFPDPVSPIHP